MESSVSQTGLTQSATTRACPRGASLYTWQAGDTAAAVALRFGTTEQALRLVNEFVDFSQLLPGDSICIPPNQLTCLTGNLYTVKRGDTFASIAAAYGITTLELSERNPYVDPSALTVGQVLCVPRADEEGTGGECVVGACTPRCPEGYTTGVVTYGQTYADILLEYDISYQAFRLTNPGIAPNRLYLGQRYCIPPAGTRGLCTAGKSEIMSTGETLSSVSARLGVTPGQMLRLNPNLAPSDFVPGRVICVP